VAKQEAVPVKVKAGQDIDDGKLVSFTVEQDLDQPDMAAIQLNNDSHEFTNSINLGDDIEIKVGTDETVIFKGEVVALEGLYKQGGGSRLLVRGFNKLHRLVRGPKSRTYVDKKDSDIASQIAQENGLSADAEATSVTHKHVYQHNMTDLAFLRQRAARNGYEVLVDDRTLHFRKPKVGEDSGVELGLNDAEQEGLIKTFTPRLSSAQVVSEVEVRAWDPEKKEVIVGKASASSSPLGSKTGASASSGAFGKSVSITVDSPVASVDEATKLAEARLGDLTMGYITGDAMCKGNEKLKAGISIKITVNTEETSDRFNGKYFLLGCTHRYRHSGGAGGGAEGAGYTTLIRFSRDAEKGQ